MHNKLITSKRGVSPLIATVLLIAFAVALGAVVMSWGQQWVSETQEDVKQDSLEKMKCTMDLSMKIIDIGNVPQICYGGSGDDGYLDFMVKNDGKAIIKELEVVVIGATDIYTNDSLNGTVIDIGRARRENITYSYSDFGSMKQVIITPRIEVGNRMVSCSDGSIEKDNTEISNCSSI
ncbi:MAG: hypothetical protein GY861_04450 [bacterium]|nr:hypothetical protein [bacterium]